MSLCCRVCVCMFMCVSSQIKKSKHNDTKKWNYGFINSGTFYLCRSSLNDGQGLIFADLDQITLHTVYYIHCEYPYNLVALTVAFEVSDRLFQFSVHLSFPPLSVSDHYSSGTCFKTLYDGGLNRCLNQIVFHYTKNNITIPTFQWSSLARGCCAPPSHLYALWIRLR